MNDQTDEEALEESSSVSELPKGWVEAKFTDFLDIQGGTQPPKSQFSESYKDGLVRLLQIRDFSSDEKAIYIKDSHKWRKCNEEDILIARYGASLGRILTGKTGAYNVALAKVVFLRQYFDRKYIFYLLKTPYFQNPLLSTSRSAQNGFNKDDLDRILLPVTPLNEQRRIVAKLDSLFVRSRYAREELERIPKLIERYKQAVLTAAFRGDLTADWREENNSAPLIGNKTLIDGRLDELPSLPDEWVWRNVGQVAEVTGGLTKNQSRTRFEKKVPYLRVANVYANELRLNEILEIGIAETEWERVRLKSGDLLIVEGNGSLDQIGRVALWNGEVDPCAHQNHLIKMRVGDSILSEFALYWLLSSSGRRAIEQVASSSAGLHTLSISKVSALPIPLCSIKEMKVVVERIEKLFKAVDLIEQQYQKASKLYDRLEQPPLPKPSRVN